jgi:arylsulfatase A-like enzyme
VERAATRRDGGRGTARVFAPLVIVELFLATVLLLRCAQVRSTAPDRPADVPSLHLLDAIASATIEGPSLAELRGEATLAGTAPPRFRDPFDTTGADWLEGRELLDPPEPPVRSLERDPVEQRDALYLPTGCGGLHRIVELDPEESVTIVARVRPIVATGPRPALTIATLEQLPTDADARARLRATLPPRLAPRKRADSTPTTAIAPDRLADRWQTLAVLVPSEKGRRGVRVSLAEGAGVLVDEFVVRRATPCERIGLARDDRDAPGAHPLVASVRNGTMQMRSLLLPAGTRVRFELPIPRAEPRLDCLLALHPQGAQESVRLSCRIDGRTLGERAIAPGQAVASWSPSLAEFGGRRVALELTVEGPKDAVVAMGDPWLLSGGARRAGPNVILLSIDTLRRDALGCFGGRDAHTPAIDALAARGVAFSAVTSPVSFTLPAHASMLSGQHPLEHGVVAPSRAIDPERTPLLADRFAAAGWQTAAFTGGALVHPDFGFAHGFQSYEFGDPAGVARMFQPTPAALSADGRSFAALAPVLDWIDRRADQPFFLFLHTYFVHNYVPSAEFAERHAARHRPGLELPDGSFKDDLSARMRATEKEPGSGAELHKLYQAAVDEVDARLVGPLLDKLDRRGLSDRTIFVLVSDHGDEFQEHGALFHGRFLWNELVDVPLIVHGPGVQRGARRDDAARLEDVAPTIAALAGLPPDERVFGRDLFAAAPDDEPRPRLLHIANRDQLGEYRWDGLILGRYTLLRQHLEGDERRDHLFDTEADPGEQHDLAEAKESERALLALRLDAEMLRTMQKADALPGQALHREGEEAELLERLKALGYGFK